MRKLFTLLFLSFAIISCETEPLDPSLNSGAAGGGVGAVQVDFVGTWDVTENDLESQTTTTFMGQTTTIDSTSELVGGNPTFTFNSDGTFVQAGTMQLQVVAAGQTQTQTVPFNSSGTFTLNGSVITLYASGQTQDYLIQTITPTLIELEGDISQTVSVGGATNTISATQYITFER